MKVAKYNPETKRFEYVVGATEKNKIFVMLIMALILFIACAFSMARLVFKYLY